MMNFLRRKKPEAATDEKQVRYGDMNTRLFASTMDLAIIYIVVDFLTRLIYSYVYPDGSAFNILSAQVLAEYPQLANQSDKVFMVIVSKYPDGAVRILNQMMFVGLLQFFLVGLYIIPMTKYFGGTVAKRFMGLRVIDSITGKNIGLAQSFIRYIAYLPSVLILGLGIITGMINKRKRCWHDMLADTLVVYSGERWYTKYLDRVQKYFHLK